jgi:hypothetical protein
MCGKKLSLHYLKYKHICKRRGEITDEARERAMDTAVARLRRRLGVEEK